MQKCNFHYDKRMLYSVFPYLHLYRTRRKYQREISPVYRRGEICVTDDALLRTIIALTMST